MGGLRRTGARMRWVATLAAITVSAAPVPMASATEATSGTAGSVITSPVDNAPVGGEIEVTVQSTAPEVLVAWEPEVGAPVGLYPSPTIDGVVTRTLSTSGYAGPTTIVARECTSEGVCDGAQASVQVEVDNPSPVWDTRNWLDEVHGDALIPLVEEGPWARYGFLLDGEYVPPVWNGAYFILEVGYLDLADGAHTLRAAHCTELAQRIFEPVVCDMANSTERSFTLRTALHPTITDVRHRTISPDGNGIADTASVTATADTNQFVRWELLRGSEVVASRAVGEQAAGPHTFTVDGLDTTGKPLPSGTYELKLRAFAPPSSDVSVDNRVITGEASTTLTIDLDAPRVSDVSATPGRFHPPVDGYRDRVRMTGTLTEPVSRLHVQLLRDGRVVRTLRLGPHATGRFATSWDGRVPVNRLAKPGYYRYRFVVRDRVGNVATRPGGRIHLSWRR
jgi:flagellar hook assembly protein FlgD